jgi:hypothetical protein
VRSAPSWLPRPLTRPRGACELAGRHLTPSQAGLAGAASHRSNGERGKEIAIDAGEIILLADAKIGELTREIAKVSAAEKGQRSAKNVAPDPGATKTARLKAEGLSTQDASRCEARVGFCPIGRFSLPGGRNLRARMPQDRFLAGAHGGWTLSNAARRISRFRADRKVQAGRFDVLGVAAYTLCREHDRSKHSDSTR